MWSNVRKKEKSTVYSNVTSKKNKYKENKNYGKRNKNWKN